MVSPVHHPVKKRGQPPGTPVYTGDKRNPPPSVTLIRYDTKEVFEKQNATCEDCLQSKALPGITWINVVGLNDAKTIEELGKCHDIHPLTIEDILSVDQRPKVDEFDNYLFITLKAITTHEKGSKFTISQVSLILGKNFIISFQETETGLFDSIVHRLKSSPKQRMREQGPDYLIYRLIDAVIDDYFVALELLSEQMEKVEERIISSSSQYNARSIYRLRRQMLVLRKAVWPVRELINHLLNMEGMRISKFTRMYLRDLYDHAIQAIDTFDTFRDMLSSLLDMYLSSLTNRMNEIMKTLTIIMTIFIPITSIASIYGMNFPEMPGVHWRWGYHTVIVSMLLVTVLMILYFWRKKWITFK